MSLAYKLFGGIFIVTLLFVGGYYWLWIHPERFNGVARDYLRHEQKLTVDSVRWHRDSVGIMAIMIQKDTSIAKLTKEANASLAYGQQWKGKYNSQVALIDATSDRLTDRQRELLYYKQLVRNGTLAPGLADSLRKADAPEVIRAGLKTANREELAQRALDSLSESIGRFATANERLGRGLNLATTGLGRLSASAIAKKKGGIWPFNAKRRKQLKVLAGSSDSLRREVEKVSEIERILNNSN